MSSISELWQNAPSSLDTHNRSTKVFTETVKTVRESDTYIVAEGDEVFAGVISEESEGLVEASLSIQAGVLAGQQGEIRQLELIQSALIAHRGEHVLKSLLLCVFDLD